MKIHMLRPPLKKERIERTDKKNTRKEIKNPNHHIDLNIELQQLREIGQRKNVLKFPFQQLRKNRSLEYNIIALKISDLTA